MMDDCFSLHCIFPKCSNVHCLKGFLPLFDYVVGINLSKYLEPSRDTSNILGTRREGGVELGKVGRFCVDNSDFS